MNKKHVVIVGGRFAGLNAARRLAHEKQLKIALIVGKPWQVYEDTSKHEEASKGEPLQTS